MNILIISAHPDDETIGMGGTIFKLKSQGHKIYWLILTRGFTPKWSIEVITKKFEEVEAVGKFYGFEKIWHAQFKAASLATYAQHEISDEIFKAMKESGAETIYIPPLIDVHQDHEIAASATLVAAKQIGSKVNKILSFEIPVTSKATEAKKNAQKFDYFVNVDSYFKKKLEAMKLYKSELKKLPHARSLEGLKILARERGLHAGFEYAECFCLVLAKEK